MTKCSHSARVDDYFSPVIREVEEGDHGALGVGFTASFRGRPLQGKVLRIPEGFTGVLLQEKSPMDSMEVCCLQIALIVSSIEYWQVQLAQAFWNLE